MPTDVLRTERTVPKKLRESTEGISVQGLLAIDILLDNSESCLTWKSSLPSRDTLMKTIPFWWDPALQALLPEAASKLLSSQKRKLRSDWELVTTKLPSVLYDDFEYDWFIVGTRTFYYTYPDAGDDLDPDECLALLPIADYFNHADVGCTVNFSSNLYTFSTNQRFTKDEQIFISYGNHTNDFLLAEYGFCLAENQWDSVCLDLILLPYFNEESKETLKSADYWGNYTLDATSVCYRTEVALRLLCMPTEAWRQSLNNVFDIRDEIRSATDDLLLGALQSYASTVREKVHRVSLLDHRHEFQKMVLIMRWKQILRLVDAACTKLQSHGVKDKSSLQ